MGLGSEENVRGNNGRTFLTRSGGSDGNYVGVPLRIAQFILLLWPGKRKGERKIDKKKVSA
jgi:hypothetical protein